MNVDQVEKIHDFEEECMEDLAREKEYKKNTSTEERIHRTAERFFFFFFHSVSALFYIFLFFIGHS